ncbi:toll/interleukin-1 receptor domain-containing protein [Streptomyces sp. W16]|uniref:toll/interleukin-1 receptor domain-containing protein n=1 Tax=Streptomyces sp. W16 TaxID=3076631 RepID=UPI00295AA6A8|nr:toll/interleukin-1 receptor domain-containing protein [Streptomyces sp. W16]MDV9173140.1 toll/interleukin-1 receptor domain-containing protein [Streptomyces sp. W16]
MRVFLSWSGAASRLCAEALRDWLPFMNQGIAPFVSSQDISKGERGLDKIASKLQDSTFGIVCVTRENQHAPWINFEAGALSRELGESMLAPFLLDLEVKDLSGPVAQFQATESTSRDEVWALVKCLNENCETVIDSDRLQVTFDRFWSDIEEKLNVIRESRPSSSAPQRDTPEILNELVALVREQSSRINSMTKQISRIEGENQAPRYVINDPSAVTINTHNENEGGDKSVEILRHAITSVVGPDNIIETRIKTEAYADITMIVTDEGFSAAQQNVTQLQAIASRARVSATIRTSNLSPGNSVVLAPF